MPAWRFRFGDALDSEDPLAVWACTLAIAFNDVVYANLKVTRATTDWERFYEWRVATGHFNEACLHLERTSATQAVREFLDTEPDVRALHAEVLTRYDALKPLTNRVRNEAAFHYPYETGQRAVTRALRDLRDEVGEIAGRSTTIAGARLHFADEVVARLVYSAAGGSDEAYADATREVADGVTAFARFANHALDAYFVTRRITPTAD